MLPSGIQRTILRGRHNREAKPLKTADDAAKNKLNQFRDMLFTERMTEAQFGYEKRPLAFEVTGAMGNAMQKHVKEMAKKYASKFPEGTAIPSLQQQGDPDHTWTANSFIPMLQQVLAVNITRNVAQMIKSRRRDAINEQQRVVLFRICPHASSDIFSTFWIRSSSWVSC